MEKKRIVSLLLALSLLLSLAQGAFAATLICREHVWNGGTVNRQPTCTEPGEATYECTNPGCTATEKREIPAKGHTPVTVPGKAATCTEAGLTEGSKCSVCGTVLTAQQTIPARGHTPAAVPGRPATCTEAGLTEGSVCSVCGTVLTAQSSLPATGHEWGGWVVDVPPNCEQGGLEYATCRKCGEQIWRYGTPLGHDWDEGTRIGDPGHLMPGATVYTCKNCGVTRTETDPEEKDLSLFTKLLTGGSKAPDGVLPEADGTELRVETQPEGGSVSRGGEEMCPMHVTVAGGIPPYEYQWYRESDFTGVAHAKPDSFAGVIAAAENQASGGYTDTSGKIAEIVKGKHTIGSLAEFEPSKHGIIAVNTSGLNENAFSMRIGAALPDAEYDSYGAVEAGRYYCKITDAEGNHVYSDSAEVRWKIRITSQPQDGQNIGTGDVFLHAEAADGWLEDGQAYEYTWYDGNGVYYNDGDDPSTIQIYHDGEYYCVVKDGKGESATSVTVNVYDFEPLEADMFFDSPEQQFLDKGAQFVITFKGGVAPYVVEWGLNGEEQVIYGDLDKGLTEGMPVSEAGTYHLHVKDSMNHHANVFREVYKGQLEIQQQPEGGTMSAEGGAYPLSIMMKNGQQPFTYYLCTNDDYGEFWRCDEIDNGNWMASFDVYFGGDYYIEAVDAENNYARSDTVHVEPYHNLEITEISPDGVIMDPDVPYRVEVTVAGGEEPYTYKWYRIPCGELSNEWQLQNETAWLNLWPDAVDYWYYCVVTDAAGSSVKSDYVTAEYKGRTPYITQHPWSNSIVSKGSGTPTLFCRAVCGDKWEPLYMWQHFRNGEWYDIKGTGTGTTFRPIDDYVYGGSGAWRCKVTDPRSGKSAYSKTAYVYLDMKVLSFEQVGKEDQLKVVFEGGVAPFEIGVMSKHARYYNEDGYDVDEYDVSFKNTGINLGNYYYSIKYEEHNETFSSTIDVQQVYDTTEITIGVPHLYSRELYSRDVTFTLIPPWMWIKNTYKKVPYMYEVYIRDALGNFVTTNYLPCKWD